MTTDSPGPSSKIASTFATASVISSANTSSSMESFTNSESGYGTNRNSQRLMTSSSDEESAKNKSKSANNSSYGVASFFLNKQDSYDDDCDHSNLGISSNSEVSERDIFDLLKFSYILRATKLGQCDLASIVSPVHDWCHELKDSLMDRPILKSCSTSYLNKVSSPNVATGKGGEELSLQDEHSRTKPHFKSKVCSSSVPLQDFLTRLYNESLLQSVLPYLAESPNHKNENNDGTHHESLGDNNASNDRDGSDFELSMTNGSGVVVSKAGSGKSTYYNRISSNQANIGGSNGRLERKNKDKAGSSAQKDSKNSREVTIHVCDDNKDEKRDFFCPEHLLLEQMGYFRDITSGQSLEDVDISVHCDINIFEWLMKWVKRNELNHEDSEVGESKGPLLEVDNVLSILVSASFLRMDNLVTVVLKFAHKNMNKILAVNHNLNCLGEPLMTKLSCLFTPTEIEDLADRKDRIHTKLYIKLIQALVEPLPQPDRELFHSASSLHRCRLCGMYLTQNLSRILPCQPLRSCVNRRGEIVPKHQRDPNFNLNDFLKTLRAELKSWRRVFWRLWGMTHPMYCSLCHAHFPAYLHEFCSFHPHDPEFTNIQFKNSSQPFGKFPCCGKSVFRFHTAPAEPHNGCQSRDHRVKLQRESPHDAAIYRILMAHRDIICLCPPRKSGIIMTSDSASITLPKPLSNQIMSKDDIECVQQDLSLLQEVRKKYLIDHSLLNNFAKPPAPTPLPQPVVKKNLSCASLSSIATSATAVNIAARRWRNITYGRLKKAPKLPVKVQSSESSSTSNTTTEDLSEDGSSSGMEDGEEEADYRMEKDLAIEIKFAKEQGERAKSQFTGGMNKSISTSQISESAQGSSSKKGNDSNSTLNYMKWDPERSTRTNQDNQREHECLISRDIVKQLTKVQQQRQNNKNDVTGYMSGVNLGHPMTNRTWVNLQMAQFGGSFFKLEQDWKETHMAYLQHRSLNNSLHPNQSGTSRTATPSGLRPNSQSGNIRPGSAASLRSARLMRVGK